MVGLHQFVDNSETMESAHEVQGQSCESLEELSLNNLEKLTGVSLEIVRKISNSGTVISLTHDELMEMFESKVMRRIGLNGVKKLHCLGKTKKISFEELELLNEAWLEQQLSVSQLQKLCDAEVILKLESEDLECLVYVMSRQTDITIDEIIKLSVTGALRLFTGETIIRLSKKGYIKSLSTPNLKKYCGKETLGKINNTNREKIFDSQEIISHLSEVELGKLCNDKPFLDGVTSKELLDAVLEGKYTTDATEK